MSGAQLTGRHQRRRTIAIAIQQFDIRRLDGIIPREHRCAMNRWHWVASGLTGAWRDSCGHRVQCGRAVSEHLVQEHQRECPFGTDPRVYLQERGERPGVA